MGYYRDKIIENIVQKFSLMENMKEVSGRRRESESLIVKDEIENRGISINSSALFGLFCFFSQIYLVILTLTLQPSYCFTFLVFNFFFFEIVHH